MIVEKKLEGKCGRDAILRQSEEDRKYKINTLGRLAEDNAFGEIVDVDKETGKICAVICGHGGSMWLCRACKDTILKEAKN